MSLRLLSATSCKMVLLACFGVFMTALAQPRLAQAQEAVPATAQPVSTFSAQQIEKLVAPIALYPDALLAQVLTAAAYPGDIVRAARWLERNREAASQQDFSSADAQNWDPSVKALLRFPTVLEKMNADLDWVTDLGVAFVHQPKDVAAVVQTLRDQAASAGTLQTTPQQRIRRARDLDREVIYIESVEPDVIYVPSYDPVLVYRPYPSLAQTALITFGSAVIIRTIIKSRDPWNWRTGAVYRPYWPGYRVARSHVSVQKPWRPDPARYRSAYAGRPVAIRPIAVQRPVVGRPTARYEKVRRPYAVRATSAYRPSVSRPYVVRPAGVRAPAPATKTKKPTRTYPYSSR